MANRRRFWFGVCLAAFVCLSVECIAFVGLRLLSYWKNISFEPIQVTLSSEQRALLQGRLNQYTRTGSLDNHHPVLGWRPPKSHASPDKRVITNTQGIRSAREFPLQPADALLRVSTFGDSFTFGEDVSNEDTWQEQASRSGKNIEVLNFGAGAYGLDQAYLRYLHEGTAYHPDIVVIGFMSENIFRSVNVFRPFYSAAYALNLFPKPRFVLEADRLVLLENPMKTVADLQRLLDRDREVLAEFGRHDYYYQRGYRPGAFDSLPSVRLGKILLQRVRTAADDYVLTLDGSYNVESEAFKVTERTFDEFVRAALANGSLPLIVVYPNRGDMRRAAQMRACRYEPLLQRFREKRYRYIDLMTAFAEHPEASVADLTTGPFLHYSAQANKIVAEYLLRYLEQNRLGSRAFVHQKTAEERARLGLS